MPTSTSAVLLKLVNSIPTQKLSNRRTTILDPHHDLLLQNTYLKVTCSCCDQIKYNMDCRKTIPSNTPGILQGGLISQSWG